MDRTEATIRNLLTALPAHGHDLGILGEGRMYRLEAAADMAFCIAAWSQPWAASDIADELSRSYLSRDINGIRKASYINPTVTKALRWAA